MTISQSREEGKGLLFLSRQNGLLSPCTCVSSFSKNRRRDRQTNRRAGASTSSEINIKTNI
jgi:hypothetical protein